MKEIIETTSFGSYYKSFNEKENWTWQQAYFRLLSWKNTWGIPLIMDICSTVEHEPYLYLVVPRDKTEHVRDYLEGLGYGEIIETETNTLKISVDWEEDLDEVVAEFY